MEPELSLKSPCRKVILTLTIWRPSSSSSGLLHSLKQNFYRGPTKFCAAHKYWNEKWSKDKNYQVFGDDVRVHGHNYILDITITGTVDEDSGFIYDIQKLKSLVDDKVIKVLDHSQIQEDINWFKGKQPSTENLVLFIWEII